MKKYVEASCARCGERKQNDKCSKDNCQNRHGFCEEEGSIHTDLVEEQEQRLGRTLDLVQIFNMGRKTFQRR